MSSHNSSSANDPRQPSTAKKFVPQAVASQDLPVDYAGFIAVVLGVAGVMFRVRTEIAVYPFDPFNTSELSLNYYSFALFVINVIFIIELFFPLSLFTV